MLDRIGARLEHYLDLTAQRQKLTVANIANVDTPGYTTRDIDFQFEFESLVNGAEPRALEVAGLAAKNDGNNVSMEREMRMLAENATRFSIASQLLRDRVRVVRSAIQGGKG
jgi:flagellar basal-body rod protein FlgB